MGENLTMGLCDIKKEKITKDCLPDEFSHDSDGYDSFEDCNLPASIFTNNKKKKINSLKQSETEFDDNPKKKSSKKKLEELLSKTNYLQNLKK